MAEPTSHSEPTTQISRRMFLKQALVVTAGLGSTGVASYTYANAFEPNFLTISNVTIPLSNLSEVFDGYRVVQVSDIHFGTWMNRERLQRVVDLVNEQQPDVIALTGDFVTRGEIYKLVDSLIGSLSQLVAQDGVLAVLGNHDHWTNPALIRDILIHSGIKELRNDLVVFERDGAKLAFGGVDDVWEKRADLDRVIIKLPDEDIPAILLVHEPDYADLSAASGRFALQLSGHSHGGQVRIPFVGAPILPPLGKKYPIGMYQVRDMIQYTNRGVGMTSPNFRFGCPPEITVFTLTSKQVQ